VLVYANGNCHAMAAACSSCLPSTVLVVELDCCHAARQGLEMVGHSVQQQARSVLEFILI
jgi:hypothetical protein